MKFSLWRFCLGASILMPGAAASAISADAEIRIDHPDLVDGSSPLAKSKMSVRILGSTGLAMADLDGYPSFRSLSALTANKSMKGVTFSALPAGGPEENWEVTFDRWPVGAPLDPSRMDPRWNMVVDIADALAAYYQNYQDGWEAGPEVDRGEYFNIWVGDRDKLTALILCAGIVVEADAFKSITLPGYVRDLADRLCSSKTPALAMDLASVFPGNAPVPDPAALQAASVEYLQDRQNVFLSSIASRICYPGSWPLEDATRNILELLKHGWIRSDDFDAENDVVASFDTIHQACTGFVYRNVLSRMGANLAKFAQEPTAALRHADSYMKDLVASSLVLQKSSWVALSELHDQLTGKLAAIFAPANAAFTAKLSLQDFNLLAVQEAAQAGVKGVNLLGHLFDRAEAEETAFFSELEKESQSVQRRVLRRLWVTTSARCQMPQVDFDCIYDGVYDVVFLNSVTAEVYEESELLVQRNIY